MYIMPNQRPRDIPGRGKKPGGFLGIRNLLSKKQTLYGTLRHTKPEEEILSDRRQFINQQFAKLRAKEIVDREALENEIMQLPEVERQQWLNRLAGIK